MDAGIEVKVEPYDETHECLDEEVATQEEAEAAFTSLRSSGIEVTLALLRAMLKSMEEERGRQHKLAGGCPTCGRKTVEERTGARAGTAATSEMIHLTAPGTGGDHDAEVARVTERGAREDAIRAVGGTLVAGDEVRRGVRGGRADARGGRSGKGKEIAWAEAGWEAGGDGAATSAGAGGAGGGSKGKGRADNGSARAGGRGSGGESSGRGSKLMITEEFLNEKFSLTEPQKALVLHDLAGNDKADLRTLKRQFEKHDIIKKGGLMKQIAEIEIDDE